MKIRIKWPRGELTASLDDTPSARALWAVLPRNSSASTWGEEVYFSLPVDAKLEPGARQVVDPGTVCFWVQGRALALPYGPTPVSEGSECRLITKANVLGKVDGDPRLLGDIKDGDLVTVETLSA